MNNISDELEEIKICIICLENVINEKEINENEKLCDKCTLNIHNKCLENWYKIKKTKVCPICLKK